MPTQQKCSKMYENVTDKFKEDSMMCAGGEDRDACQVTNKIFNIHSVRFSRCIYELGIFNGLRLSLK